MNTAPSFRQGSDQKNEETTPIVGKRSDVTNDVSIFQSEERRINQRDHADSRMFIATSPCGV